MMVRTGPSEKENKKRAMKKRTRTEVQEQDSQKRISRAGHPEQ
jgi:hypothetical protein